MSSENFKLMLSLLDKLRKVVLVYGNDSDEANEVRDEMDKPWYALTEEEQDTFRNGEI